MTATEAEVQAAARALCAADDSMYHHDRTDDMPCTTCRETAVAALAAVEPLIRERLAQEIEAEREDSQTERADLIVDHEPIYTDGHDPYAVYFKCAACDFKTNPEDDHEQGRVFALHVIALLDANYPAARIVRGDAS